MLRVIPVILFTLFASAPSFAQTAAPALFDVHVYGIKVGELRIANTASASTYSASARFATSGLVAKLKTIRLLMKTTGTLAKGVYRPQLYVEDVNTGRRQSSAQLHYSGGIPALTGGRSAPRDGVPPLDPAKQRGTLDPLTAMMLTLRDQPAALSCNLDLQVFDGARRTRVVLNGTPEQGDSPTCSGQFMRVAGYSAERLAKNGRVPLRITYGPVGGPDKATMQVVRLQMKTSRGPVTLTRR